MFGALLGLRFACDASSNGFVVWDLWLRGVLLCIGWFNLVSVFCLVI